MIRPAIFSGPMVLRLLARTKWQTRRKRALGGVGDELYVKEAWRTIEGWDELPPRDCWWSEGVVSDDGARGSKRVTPVQYIADGAKRGWPMYRIGGDDEPPHVGCYRHARFMPRALSRLTLGPLVEVRTERVGAITDEDAIAEGAYNTALRFRPHPTTATWTLDGAHFAATPREAFLAGFAALHKGKLDLDAPVVVHRWEEIR